MAVYHLSRPLFPLVRALSLSTLSQVPAEALKKTHPFLISSTVDHLLRSFHPGPPQTRSSRRDDSQVTDPRRHLALCELKAPGRRQQPANGNTARAACLRRSLLVRPRPPTCSSDRPSSPVLPPRKSSTSRSNRSLSHQTHPRIRSLNSTTKAIYIYHDVRVVPASSRNE